MKVTVEFEPGEEVIEKALNFYSARAGYQNVGQYVVDQILCSLETEESSDDYFKDVRKEFQQQLKVEVA